MPRFAGSHPKSGGRKKGTPNKTTKALIDLLDSVGLDPARKIAELLPQLDAREQCAVLLKLMEYIYPKRKAIELSGPNGDPIQKEITRTDEPVLPMRYLNTEQKEFLGRV